MTDEERQKYLNEIAQLKSARETQTARALKAQDQLAAYDALVHRIGDLLQNQGINWLHPEYNKEGWNWNAIAVALYTAPIVKERIIDKQNHKESLSD